MKKKFLLASIFALGTIFALTGCKPKAQNPNAETHTVTFYEDKDCTIQYGQSVSVEDGKLVARPSTNPSKEETDSVIYEFNDWFDYETEEVFDFTKAVKKDHKIYADFNETTKESDDTDLYVFIFESSSLNVFITSEEATALKSYLTSEFEGKNIVFREFNEISTSDYCEAVNEFGKVDVCIGGSKINPKTETEGDVYVTDIAKSDTEEVGRLTKVASGWFQDSSRYVGIVKGEENPHFELAKQLYDMLLVKGPYDATLSSTSVNVEVEDTETVTIQVQEGQSVTWTSSNTAVATVNNGVITGVSEGSATITAKVGPINYEVSVTVVLVRVEYSITIYVAPRAWDYLDTVKSIYEPNADSYCTDVNWIKAASSDVTAFSGEVNAYDEIDGNHTDMVIAHNQVTSGHENGLANTTYAYEFSRVLVSSTYINNAAINYYCGIVSTSDTFQKAECAKIAAIFAAENPDLFELSETSASLLLEGTVQISAKDSSVLAFTSSSV